MADWKPVQNLSQATAEVINYFRKYRGADEWNDDEIRRNFQKHSYQPPTPVQLPEPQQLDGWPAPIAAKAAKAPTRAEQDFLTHTIPDLEDPTQTAFSGGAGNWKATRLLGAGGFGMVALWEYQGPTNMQDQKYRQVVVKETMSRDPGHHNMPSEYRILNGLQKTGSAHVNHVLTQARPIDTDVENIGEEWDGLIKRLILEYCPLGDMRAMIARFQTLGRPLREISIWKIFDCLVDGLFVLETGNDAKVRAPTSEVSIKPRLDWDSIVHFDLKPDNILLSEDRFTHFTPLCKEQFSAIWESRDYKESDIAGEYGYKTNAWGIGCILHRLVLLTNLKLDHNQPFEPTWQINGKKAKGNTFGLELRGLSENYSRALIDLVHECLYEIPSHRPQLTILKTRVRDGYQAALDAGGTQDAWEDFLPAPPLPAARLFCIAKLKSGKNCVNRAKFGDFCGVHKKQRYQVGRKARRKG